jgi:NADH-quinone oxidoreductase subunit F
MDQWEEHFAWAGSRLVGKTAIGRANPSQSRQLLEGRGFEPRSILGGEPRILSGNCGRGHPTTLDEYLSSGGSRYAKALDTAIVIASKGFWVVGRGGAAFPTGIIWEGSSMAKGEKRFVVCNADESEPGTFKDRVLMEEDPHLILEGLVIA